MNEKPPTPEAPAMEEPRLWRFAPDAWRAALRLSPRMIDLYLKFRGGQGVPASILARIQAMRIPDEHIRTTLSNVHGLGDWMGAWNGAAQQFLNDARREDGAGQWEAAAVARRNAAMCYHVAHFVTDTDPRTVRALKAAGISSFAQAIPKIIPDVRRVLIAWRASQLPAYFVKPAASSGPMPLVVMLNGATTTKEETLLWSDRFVANGVAYLALDWPGTGEAASHPLSPDCDDITDGIVSFVMDEPALDPSAIFLCGFSLGGSPAIRATALDRRIAGAIVVTPPYEPRSWIRYVNGIVRQQFVSLAIEDEESSGGLIEDFSLADVMPRFRSPLLIFGAARDLTVPPEESLHLAAAAGEFGTLVWYPAGSHGLYEFLDDWTEISAHWILQIAGHSPTAASTQVDAAEHDEDVSAASGS